MYWKSGLELHIFTQNRLKAPDTKHQTQQSVLNTLYTESLSLEVLIMLIMYQLHVSSLHNLHIMTGQKQIAEVMHLGHDSGQHLRHVWPPLNTKVNRHILNVYLGRIVISPLYASQTTTVQMYQDYSKDKLKLCLFFRKDTFVSTSTTLFKSKSCLLHPLLVLRKLSITLSVFVEQSLQCKAKVNILTF